MAGGFLSLFSDSVVELAPWSTILSAARSNDWFKLSQLWASKDNNGSKIFFLFTSPNTVFNIESTVFNIGGFAATAGGGSAGGDEGKLARVGSCRRGLILLFGDVFGKGEVEFSNVDVGELSLVGSALVLVVAI